MINFAIVGPGKVARYHQQAIAASADLGAGLRAIAHHNPARFTALAERFGVPCRRYADVLADPAVDVVCLCTPSGQHADQAVAAAAAGKHVLVEKPMALRRADADRMIAACRSAGVQMGVVYQRRAEPLFQEVARAVHGGGLGRMTCGAVLMPYLRDDAYYRSAPWRGTWAQDGGGVLMNQGIHLVDLLVWYLGDPVAVTAAAATLHHGIEVEDTLVATLRFAGGALATVTATTTAAPGFAHQLALHGTQGGIQLEGETVRAWQVEQAAERAPAPASAPAAAGAGRDPQALAPTAHARYVRSFIHSLTHGHPLLVDGLEGRRSLDAVQAIYQAAGLHPPAGGG